MSILLKLNGESRLYLGGYDTQFHEEDPFRTQSLKGLWRYWLRAYIAGAMYDAGLLECEEEGNLVCGIDPESLNKIVEKTGDLLGSQGSASKFRIVVNRAKANRKEDEFAAQRIRLLSMGKRGKISYGDKAYAEIIIEKSPHVKRIDENEIKVVIGSLLTALSLNGLGKGGRRGLGTFSVEVEGFKGDFLVNGKLDHSKLRELIRETMKSVRSYLNLDRGKPSEMPPIDCISEAKIDLSGIVPGVRVINLRETPVFMIVRAKPREDKSTDNMVIELQDFFYRPARLRRMKYRISSADESRDGITRERLAWFLGLPRMQKMTGYIYDGRRASAVHLAVHKEGALFTFFLSGDWPTEMVWIGRRRKNLKIEKNLKIDRLEVKKAYITSVSSLLEYLDRIGYESEVIYL
jgi:CRISPR-associated protein Cmr1